MANIKEELKSLLMRVKEESERASLRLNIEKNKIMALDPITAWQIEGEKMETVTDFLFLGSKITTEWWLQPWNQKTVASWQESDDKPRQCVEKQRHYCADKGPYSQGYGLPSGHAWLWELDGKEGRTPKNDTFELWCWRRLLNNEEIKPVNLKGNQPWIFTGRADAEAEGPVFWSSDADKQLIGKVPDAGKDWGQKEKRASQDVMAGRHHQLSGYELSKLQEMVKDREAR